MSAAATAAGYLYASGRMRDRLTCDKRKYPSEIAALSTASHRTSRGAPPLRAYPCILCNCWHLTSDVR